MLKASGICVGNSMICSDIWREYHKWYFQIVKRNLRQFWNIMSGICAKYQVQIMLLFVYTTDIYQIWTDLWFTCRYFKLSWNTTALSQSNCRNFPHCVFTLSPDGFFSLFIGQLVFNAGLQHSIRDTLHSESLVNTYFIVRSCIRI